jgi:hypothetical protein
MTPEIVEALTSVKERYGFLVDSGGPRPDVVITASSGCPVLRELFEDLPYSEQRDLATKLIEEFIDREFASASQED